MTLKESKGFHFCLKDRSGFRGPSACSYFSFTSGTRKLDSLFKWAIPSSKSLNLVCQENKNIQFTDKLLPKHMEEPVIKNKFLNLSIISSKTINLSCTQVTEW